MMLFLIRGFYEFQKATREQWKDGAKKVWKEEERVSKENKLETTKNCKMSAGHKIGLAVV